jgi:hypothetical protein
MNTEDQIDNALTNLKIIALIQKNGRLCIRKGCLTLEPDDHFQIIRRWINKDNRDLCMMHIRNTISNSIKITKSIINNQIDVELKDWTLNRFSIEMTNCQNGLTNLKTTYNDDAVTKSQLDILLERLEVHCLELRDYTAEKFDAKK